MNCGATHDNYSQNSGTKPRPTKMKNIMADNANAGDENLESDKTDDTNEDNLLGDIPDEEDTNEEGEGDDEEGEEDKKSESKSSEIIQKAKWREKYKKLRADVSAGRFSAKPVA